VATVYLNGQRRQLPPTAIIGKGGEADIFRLDGGRVLKLYKQPNDPDYAGNPSAQAGAKERLAEIQTKLPAFPGAVLPERVVSPLELAYRRSTGTDIAGYTMNYLDTEEVLLRLGDRLWREQGGIDGNQTLAVFRDLREMVEAVHQAGVVIGDFNDLNVLFDGTNRSYLVDADSMQFGKFLCRTFTARFVDPLACAPDHLVLSTPHSRYSDWYAFSTMLFQSLLFVGPYGGVHRPTSGKRLQHDDRVLSRITVFSPEVLYPKPALPLTVLPDELLDYFTRVYQNDLREVFPLQLLDNLRWTVCSVCGSVHARAKCPVCAAPGAVIQTIVRRGKVTATRTFVTRGQILHACVQNGKLRYLHYENGRFVRENGQEVVRGKLDPELRFRISGDTTLLGKRNRLLVFSGQTKQSLTTDNVGRLPIFDANSEAYFWTTNGQLVRSGKLGSSYIGDVLPDKTLFWAGDRFGLGFYQAGQMTRSFVFDTGGAGLNDRVPIPNLPGQLIDATCVFSNQLAWLMLSIQEAGRLVNHCYVVNQKGELVASASAEETDDSWLASGIRGRFASGRSLYAATDEGIVRITAANGTLQVEQEFPDTEPFVDAASQLLAGSDGIYAVSAREITLLKLS